MVYTLGAAVEKYLSPFFKREREREREQGRGRGRRMLPLVSGGLQAAYSTQGKCWATAVSAPRNPLGGHTGLSKGKLRIQSNSQDLGTKAK